MYICAFTDFASYRLALWYQLVKIDDLTCLAIIGNSKNTVGELINKNSSFAGLVSFHPYTHARTQQILPPLRAAIKQALLKMQACELIATHICVQIISFSA